MALWVTGNQTPASEPRHGETFFSTSLQRGFPSVATTVYPRWCSSCGCSRPWNRLRDTVGIPCASHSWWLPEKLVCYTVQNIHVHVRLCTWTGLCRWSFRNVCGSFGYFILKRTYRKSFVLYKFQYWPSIFI